VEAEPTNNTHLYIPILLVQPKIHSIFEINRRDALPLHYFYNLAVNLNDSNQPPKDRIYTLSKLELMPLRIYFDMMLGKERILLSNSGTTDITIYLPKPYARDLQL
jgi:hypothetical protein